MKIKVKLFIQAVKWVSAYSEQNFVIGISCYKRESDQNYIVIDIDEQEIEIDTYQPTQEELNIAHVEQLRGVKAKFQAEAQLKLNSLDEQIESLLALEHKEGM